MAICASRMCAISCAMMCASKKVLERIVAVYCIFYAVPKYPDVNAFILLRISQGTRRKRFPERSG